MQHKVKYTRKEYREEYLNSEEWKNLRNTIMSSEPDCQCCGKKASDVHHMTYRNIVDIKLTDLLPVCRSCHDYIHEAIKDEWISQRPQDIEEITSKTVNILKDDEYKKHAEWLKTKHFLDGAIMDNLLKYGVDVMRRLSGLLKKHVWYDTISSMKFTGRQIEKIKEVIQISKQRKKKPCLPNKKHIESLKRKDFSEPAKVLVKPPPRTIHYIKAERKRVRKLQEQARKDRCKMVREKFKDEIAALTGREREEFIRQKISESYN